MDSVLALVRRNTQQTELHWNLYYYMSKAMYAEADSIIDLIIAQGGGTPSAHTTLVQLQLSLLNAQVSPENMTPAQHALLEAMVEENPYGSPSAQALLSLAYHTPYKRVPWLRNDTLPEKRLDAPYSAAIQPAADWTIAPNPATSIVTISSTIALDELRMFNTNGDLVYRRNVNGGMLFQIETANFSAGLYHIQGYAGQEVLSGRVVVTR
ncbi:MAG: hypothetical protein GFGODING_03139 [Flavobacteriales bacterium]|nr:hypothetical protein [Flavobacteriales bacterium]